MTARNLVKDETIEKLAKKIMQEPDFNAMIQEFVDRRFPDQLTRDEIKEIACLVAEQVVSKQLADKGNIENWAKNDIVTERIKTQFTEHAGHDRFKDPIKKHFDLVHGKSDAHNHLDIFVDGRIDQKLKTHNKDVVKIAQYTFQNETVKNYKFWVPIAVSVIASITSLVVTLLA